VGTCYGSQWIHSEPMRSGAGAPRSPDAPLAAFFGPGLAYAELALEQPAGMAESLVRGLGRVGERVTVLRLTSGPEPISRWEGLPLGGRVLALVRRRSEQSPSAPAPAPALRVFVDGLVLTFALPRGVLCTTVLAQMAAQTHSFVRQRWTTTAYRLDLLPNAADQMRVARERGPRALTEIPGLLALVGGFLA
jgi:hypothetical protein